VSKKSDSASPPSSGPSRRALLTGASAAASVGLCAGAGGASLLPPAPRSPRRPLQALDADAFAILAAVADRICPGGPGLPSAWDLQVPEDIDALLHRKHPGDTADLVQALWLLENPVAGLLLDGRPGRFTLATPEVQDRVLDRWRRSRIPQRRMAFRALCGLISAAYWANPRTYPHIGYPGPPRFPT